MKTPILLHHAWPVIRPFVAVEVYDRDGSARNPRQRFELRSTTPPEIRLLAENIQVPCAACGALIRPFRARDKREGSNARTPSRSHTYLAVTCPLVDRIACSRGGAAKEAYEQIGADLGHVSTKKASRKPAATVTVHVHVGGDKP